MITRRSLLDLFTLSATVHRKVELSLIWAHVALFKLNTKKGCSFMVGMAQFLPFLDMYASMFLKISFDFVHRWNTQLAELTAQCTWLDLHKLSTTNHFTVFKLSSEKLACMGVSLSNKNVKVCTLGSVYVTLADVIWSRSQTPLPTRLNHCVFSIASLLS